MRGAGAVVVFQKAELHVVIRIHPFLRVQPVGVLRKADAALQIAAEIGIDIVVIRRVERLIQLRIGQNREAVGPAVDDERALDGFTQPDAAGADGRDLFSGALPEVQRHERGHVAAEAVDQSCPVFECLDLIVPQRRVAVIQIGDVPPVAEAVAERAVRLVEEPLRVILRQPRIGGCVVVDDVDDALHAAIVDGVDQMAEVVQRAELRVDGAVVADGIRAAERALAVLLAGRVDRQQPDDIRTERVDAVQLPLHGGKGAFFGVIADIDRI